jgi:hypothetical protein
VGGDMKASVEAPARAKRISAPQDLQLHRGHLIRVSRNRTTKHFANAAAQPVMKK